VGLYLPSSSMWMGDAASDAAFVAAEQMLSERQINFDIVSEDGLAKDMTVAHGAFETKSGNRITTVILPNVSLLSQESVDRLKAFAQGGGHVLFLGRTPSLVFDKSILNAKAVTTADFSWGRVVEGELPPTPTPPAQPPTEALVPQVVPAGFAEALSAVDADVRLDAADTALKVMKRRLKDADVYLFFNEGAHASSHTVTLRSEGKKVEVWDPQTAEVSSLKADGGRGAVKVGLALKPYETRVLVVR
jgi:beta-galactosidase GanA